MKTYTIIQLTFFSPLFFSERDLGKPKYDMDRTDPLENNYTPVSSVTNISSGHYPVPTLSSTITVIAPAHHGNNTTESWSEFHEEQLDHNSYGRPPLPKKRCRDYDGKSSFFSIACCSCSRLLSQNIKVIIFFSHSSLTLFFFSYNNF